MGIVAGVSGQTSITAGATSTSLDISTATDNEWVHAFLTLGATQASDVTWTGWAKVLEGDSGTGSHYALYRRKKVAGDTTFSVSWVTSSKGTLGWQQWTGLDGTAPDELAQFNAHLSSGTSYVTPSITPNAADRWAATFTYARSTTSGNKNISWTPDAALVERLDVNNSAAASAPWTGLEIADSNAAVTASSHSYNAVEAFSESHGGALLLYLIPAAASASPPPHALSQYGGFF
ncbi:hypothetical protein [Streptomyces albidoflavus]|uniref:hypothetical protein n=1 Tax=Streptomyces albidoflavus TaxID=1886 RepID=UPI0033318086